ncbi:tRNA nucleotidyltransferase/poly(A) polymerase [Candidatus Desulfofervidus auxilii]|uniref:tRNA nucleotidyltransferase/poly(A) polymerase n=1 Tax=Desulfofervidus auxilii TaxID=1621989 RepID=A0A7U4TH44_DESA2|nr:CBS domain-containing protein [Candidatus Desulfofervidus auxilii]AMM39841.1 tRNA nucleotidyltransferase/poly(A) polymerase [Candidatus Desulfofervidus auxilii]
MSATIRVPNRSITVIATHENADFDALASMVAAKKLYPEAIIIAPGSQERRVREFVLNMAIEYFKLVKLKEIDLKTIKRVVLVDNSQLSRIGALAEVVKNPEVEVHIYDHHLPPDPETPCHFSIIKPVGSTVTILLKLLREKGIKIAPEEATLMALGLYEDTGAFTFRSTTKEDLEAGAYLLECGANLNVISELFKRELTAEDVSLLNDLFHEAQTHFIRGIPVVITKVSTNHYIDDFAVLVHHFIEIENPPVLFVLARMEGRIFIIARSKLPEVNVAEILEVFNGGGHHAAASAAVKGLTPMQVEDKLLKLLDKKIKQPKVARDLMSHPVKGISPETTIEEAEAILVHYDFNALPVIKNGEVVGIITRPVVDKALYHQLSQQPVKRFMTTEFPILSPEASLSEIKEALLQHKQRIVPVVENRKLVGVITRKDFLNYLLTNPSAFLGGLDLERQPRRKFVTSLLNEKLPKHIISLLKKIGMIAENLGYNVYAVGGFVRDLLLRQENLDIDLVVEGDGITLAKKLQKEINAHIHTYQKFGTAVVILPDGFRLDIATARTEYYEFPGALPKVEMSSLKLDLYRRDFTINALAIKLNPKQFGLLLDFFGAQRDLKERMIRVLYNLSFVEDPTRILRAVRFEQRFGFRISKQTLDLIRQALKLNLLFQTTGSRIWHELKCIFGETNPAAIIERLNELSVLKSLHPALKWDKSLKKLFKEIEAVLSWFELLFLEEKYVKEEVYLLGLLDPLKEEEVNSFLTVLEFPKSKKELFFKKRREIFNIYGLWQKKREIKPSLVYLTIKEIPLEFVLYLMAKLSPAKKKWLSLYFTQWRDIKPILTGDDLKAMGLKPGPIFRTILEELLKARLDGKVKTEEDEKKLVKKILKGKNFH